MRATIVLLLIAAVGSTAQALKIRGTRRKYIVDKPVENLTPAQKEYFVRLMWLMKHPTNGSALNLGHNDAELKAKLANGGFYYDEQVRDPKESGGSHVTKYTIHGYHYGSRSNGTSHSNNTVYREKVNSFNKENHGQSKNKLEEVTLIGEDKHSISNHANVNLHEHNEESSKNDGPSKSNDRPSPYIVTNEESNNFAKVNAEQHHKHDIPSGSNELHVPYIVTGLEANSHSRESDEKHHKNGDPLRTIKRPGPYIVNSDKDNSYSKGNFEKVHRDDGLSKSIELFDPYIVKKEEGISYSKGKEEEHHVNYIPSRINELPGPYIVTGEKADSYSRESDEKHYENDTPSRSNELSGSYVIKNDEVNSYFREYEKQHHNYDGPSNNNERPGPYIVTSEEDSSYSSENDDKHYVNDGRPRNNELPAPYVTKSDEVNSYFGENEKQHHVYNGPSKNNERPGPYIVKSEEANSYSSESYDEHYVNGGPSRINELPGPYVIKSDEANNFAKENEERPLVNDGPPRSYEFPGPYIVTSEEGNRYSSENDDKHHANDGPSRINELPAPYVVKSDETNDFPKENEERPHVNDGIPRSNEFPGTYIVTSEEDNSYSSENDDKNYVNDGPSRINELPGPYVIKSDETNNFAKENEERPHVNDGLPRSYEFPGPYIVTSVEANSHSREIAQNHHEYDGPSKSYERPGPYIVTNEEVNNFAKENEGQHYVNHGPSRSNEFSGPYIVKQEEANSYSTENDERHYENEDPLKSIERPGQYIITSGEANGYSSENYDKYYVNDGRPRNNELHVPYILNIDENNNYPYPARRDENINIIRSNEVQVPYIVQSGERDRQSSENYIEYPQNNDITYIHPTFGQNEKNNYVYENERVLNSKEGRSEEDKGNSVLRPYVQKSSKEGNRPYYELDPYVQSPQIIEDSGEYNHDSNKSKYIQESIDDILDNNKGHHYHENDSEKIKPIGIDKYKHDSKHRNHYGKHHQHHHKHTESSELPRFIIKPDLSFQTLTIIPAPRLTSLVINMCDNSEPNVLNVWKRVATYLGLDSDYKIKNINEVDRLFKIIKAFVALSKNKNFLKMPLDGILWAINKNISNENDESSVEYYIKNNIYSSEKGLKERPNAPGFFVETSLEPVDESSDSLKYFLGYIFENQENPANSLDLYDISNSHESNEFQSTPLKEFVKRHRSTESPDFSSSDEHSNEKRLDDSREVSFVDVDPDNINTDQREELPVANLSEYPEPNSPTVWPYLPNPEDSSVDVLPDDIFSPGPSNSNEEETSDLPIADDQNADFQPYPPIQEFVSEGLDSDEPNSESSSHENEPGVNNSVDVSEETVNPEQYKPSITESQDPKDTTNTLIAEILGKDLSKSLLPFLNNYSQCRTLNREEVLQKLRDIVEVLQKAECF